MKPEVAASPALDAFQQAFAAALLADPAGAGLADAADSDGHALAAQPGFAVYRNTVLRGCIDALAANHPTVLALVGLEWFEAAAAAFARAHPPRDGSLGRYGDGFPAHLAEAAAQEDLPYLGGVAALDRLWMESHLAADAPVLGAAALAALSPQELAAAVLVPHPAARWARFDTAPVFTIWRRHRDGTPLDAPMAWQGEGALLTRPDAAVRWQPLDAAAGAFLDACASGLPFGEAAEAAAAAAPDGATAFAGALSALLAAGAFGRVETGADAHRGAP